MHTRKIEEVVTIPQGLNSPLISSRDVTRNLVGQRIDPYLIASLFDMKGPVFPPHPHAGFAVMTYILPESETGFRNQDSTGFSNVIAPGDLHVTFAGSGLLHEETNVVEGRSALGFQIWIDVPNSKRRDVPTATHLEHSNVPTIKDSNGVVRVVAGASNGLNTDVNIATAFRLIDVELNADGKFDQDLSTTETAYLHVTSGDLSVGETIAKAGEAVLTAREGTNVSVRAGANGARFVLFAGEPLHQQPVFGGPFVASDQEELSGFKLAFTAGEMGHLAAFENESKA